MKSTTRSCVICGKDEIKYLYHPKKSPGSVVRCLSCGMVYIAQIQDQHAIIEEGPVIWNREKALVTSDNLDDLTDCWELSLLPTNPSVLQAIRRNNLHAQHHIQELIKPPGRLLDFGCGWGFFLGSAKEQGWDVYGLEPLPGHAVYARAKSGAVVLTDTLKNDSFPDEFFDVITSFQVFEHLPDPASILEILVKKLKPGGILLIEVPNIETMGVYLMGKYHRHFVQDHLNFFSARTLSMLLEKYGLSIRKTYFPKRYLSLYHLINTWGGRYLPGPIVKKLDSVTRNSMFRLDGKIVSINLRDIVAIIAQKL